MAMAAGALFRDSNTPHFAGEIVCPDSLPARTAYGATAIKIPAQESRVNGP